MPKRPHTRLPIVAAMTLLTAIEFAAIAPAAPPQSRTIDRAALEDRIRGGWAGQMIGVSFGAPTEFRSNARVNDGDLPPWTPDRIANAIDQDDLYVEMTFAEVMDRVGLDATMAQYAAAFKASKYELWHANAGARRLLNVGIMPPQSGAPEFNQHANDIDFQIESDFIGLMSPGLPRTARDLCLRVGPIMNSGDGVYGGVFITAMYSAAFFERDPRRVVEAGLAALPPRSGYAGIIRDVLAWHAADPNDWRRTWQQIEDKWDRDDACPDGSLEPFNIDARLNGAYVALGLLYGGGDFAKTLEVATRAGQDSDCNPSSAAGILGTMIGYRGIPEEWKAGIPALAGKKFSYTNYSFDDIVASTMRRAELAIRRAGGRVSSAEVSIPGQTPAPPPLLQWDMGRPLKRVPASAPEWTWTGTWNGIPDTREGTSQPGRMTSDAGAAATLTFEGTAIAIVGELSQHGGRASVTLDGWTMRPIDAWIPERTHDDALWHAYGLVNGRHTLRIVAEGKARSESGGHEVEIREAVVYGSK
jgi:hypothetical protein